MATEVKKDKFKKRKKKVLQGITAGIATIKASFNNTIIAITDKSGHVIVTTSAGMVGFKGTKKSTPYAAQMAAVDCAKKARELGVKEIDVRVKGPGPGREAAIRSLQQAGLIVRKVRDVTPVPHNGCRPRKKRRV